MYKEFHNFDDLFRHLAEDKLLQGVASELAKRYMVRFVLFDNFRDSYHFAERMRKEYPVHVESVDAWIDIYESDEMITHSRLAENIQTFINKIDGDSIIAPFSELARFYNNTDPNPEFRSLISTLKSIELKQEQNHRLFIPVVGLEGKMSYFREDQQSFIWYYKSPNKELNYRLILSDDTYGIQGLETKYTLVSDIKEWLKIWINIVDAKSKIISTSKKIFAYSQYAQPDNAFSYRKCNNVYEFLVNGLELNFNGIAYCNEDEGHWRFLAKKIDVNNFSFELFINNYFQLPTIENCDHFLLAWVKYTDAFSRWLLTNYYYQRLAGRDYICRVIETIHGYTDRELFSAIALTIFSIEEERDYLQERNHCLQEGCKIKVILPDQAQNKLTEKLTCLSVEKGYITAIRYFSPLTNTEKELAITWYADSKITKEDIAQVSPELYNYLNPTTISTESNQQWIINYIEAYKYAKITNTYTDKIQSLINESNISQTAFQSWYNNFKTVRNVLYGREDIEVYYWIDGLGLDWIAYIDWILSDIKHVGIYLNEILIAKSLLPTRTENNRSELQLLSDTIDKKGDLDALAHKSMAHPSYIIEELDTVKRAIIDIVAEYAGKKIAIVSDHGLTALSQLRNGHNLSGVESDHHGRIALRKSDEVVSSNISITLENGKTMCALRHESLCGKTPAGQRAHGGCTPEEVIVPIIILSSQPNATNWIAKLLDNEVSGTNPTVKYEIKGLSMKEKPYLLYNNKRYELNIGSNSIYTSQPLLLDTNDGKIKLCIGLENQTDYIQINLGTEEQDLFDF